MFATTGDTHKLKITLKKGEIELAPIYMYDAMYLFNAA